MTPERLKEIKARCEVTMSGCSCCDILQDLPDCIADIERLEKLNKTITPICMYCFRKWPTIPYDDTDAYAAMVPDILEHVSVCEKNPLVQEIGRLKEACRMAYQGLCTYDDEAAQEAIALIGALET